MASTISKAAKMNNKVALLLQLIDRNADSQFLLQQGLTFFQISLLFNEATNEGLLERADGKFRLTPKGKDLLAGRKSIGSGGTSAQWIFPDEKYFVAKKEVSDIYLPKLCDSKFG